MLELATRVAALADVPAEALGADLRTDPARITAAIRQALLAHAGSQAQSAGLAPGLPRHRPQRPRLLGRRICSGGPGRGRGPGPGGLVTSAGTDR